MISKWGLVALLGGACGRLGFDAAPDVAADTGDVPLADLPCEADYATLGNLPQADEIRIAYGDDAPYAVVIHHVSATQHELHAYRLTMRDGIVVATDLGSLFTIQDIAGIALEPSGSEQVVVVSDPIARTTHVLRFDGLLSSRGGAIVADFASGIPPYSRSSAGRMTVGISTGNVLQVRVLDASFAAVGGAITIASPVYSASIAAAGAGFILSWSVPGACRFARVTANATMVAGPLTVTTPNECSMPAAAELGNGRVAYVVHDVLTMVPRAYGGTFDSALATATTPQPLAGSPSVVDQLVATTDSARVAVFNSNTARIAEIDSAGAVSQIGADIGTLSAYSALWIERVAGISMLLRVEAGQLILRRLCR